MKITTLPFTLTDWDDVPENATKARPDMRYGER